jgi:hypothetical protein
MVMTLSCAFLGLAARQGPHAAPRGWLTGPNARDMCIESDKTPAGTAWGLASLEDAHQGRTASGKPPRTGIQHLTAGHGPGSSI